MMGKESQSKVKISLLFSLVAIVIFLCFAYWVACAYLITASDKSASVSDAFARRGQFGDMFGGISALFAGLAFAGLIYTVLLQHQEIKESRKEFIEQLTIMRKTSLASTLDTLIQVQILISEKDKGRTTEDEKQSYAEALKKRGHYTAKLEKIAEELGL